MSYDTFQKYVPVYIQKLYLFLFEGGVGCGDVSYLSSTYILVYADNKGSKETAQLCL